MKKLISFCAAFLLVFPVITCADVVLEDIEGTSISLRSLSGKWVFINYWASWCGPCVHEIAALNRFYAKHSSKVAVFAVNFDAPSLAKQRSLVRQFGIHYPSLKPQSLRGMHLGDIDVVPVTYVFDPSGHLHTTLYGGQTNRGLQASMAAVKGV
ncbi:MAG: TlpA family protein disulfide reductase [Gammaproteobacteria bacterium]|nr:TlpA family protein disulfide reductase [Gammaproteobacteria bacterium]